MSPVETTPIPREADRIVNKEVEKWAESQSLELKRIAMLQENKYERISRTTRRFTLGLHIQLSIRDFNGYIIS